MRFRRACLAIVVVTLLPLGCATTSDNPGGGIAVGGTGYINANAVLAALEADGWPVEDGYPSSSDFAGLRGKTRCSSSKTFVRAESERGWGFICLGMPPDLYAQIHETFQNALVIMAPLYLDSGDGDLVVFGFGWPGDTSQKFAESLGVSGNYLLPPN